VRRASGYVGTAVLTPTVYSASRAQPRRLGRRVAPGFTIRGGSTEILRAIVSKELLR
jgi:hypothetical protein